MKFEVLTAAWCSARYCYLWLLQADLWSTVIKWYLKDDSVSTEKRFVVLVRNDRMTKNEKWHVRIWEMASVVYLLYYFNICLEKLRNANHYTVTFSDYRKEIYKSMLTCWHRHLWTQEWCVLCPHDRVQQPQTALKEQKHPSNFTDAVIWFTSILR
jgi:hypothetical protein